MASEMKEESSSGSSDVKIVDNSSEQRKMKDDDKESEKSETKEDSIKISDDEDSDEEVALLDRPVEVTGCRARKKVERLEVSFTTPKERQEFPQGKGKKLGDCPRIEAQIQKMKPVDLKPLHKILFNRTGSAHEIKKNIRKFSGFPFEKNSSDFTRKKVAVEKVRASVLKEVCLILDIERGGTKEEIVNRIMSFLLKPEASGRKVPAPKKKASKEKKKSSGKKVKLEKKVVKQNKDDKADFPFDEDEDSFDETSMGGTDEEAEGLIPDMSSEDEEEELIESKISKPKVEKRKKDGKKQKGKKRKHDDHDTSSDSSSDEPTTKKSKMPSDEEISKLVRGILESADLQEITMKKVIKQVSDTYPDFDLSHKKAFIKSTIKSIL